MKREIKKPDNGLGDAFIWLTAAAVSLALLLVGGLCALILFNGLQSFWPGRLQQLELADGKRYLGQEISRQEINAADAGASGISSQFRLQLKQGNRDLYGQDYIWLDESRIAKRDMPADVFVVERLEWGDFYGTPRALRDNDIVLSSNPEEIRTKLPAALKAALLLRKEIDHLSKDLLGAQFTIQAQLQSEIAHGADRGKELAAVTARIASLDQHLTELRASQSPQLVMSAVDGAEKVIPLSQIVRAYASNSMSMHQRIFLYLGKIWEFLSADPRESNTEGGVFPAIFGTIMAVLLMSVISSPFGVIAAVYLKEYAPQGKLVSLIRIGVSNLAGVPSIVFGVFGVGFFVYRLGGSIDQIFFADALPNPTFGTGGILWASLTLALLTVPTVIVTTEEGLASIPRELREASYALGATKFETLWRVVIPALLPSILTGVILAIARGAGEVAPLMITGVVKLAPSMPIDSEWPFLHLNRKFMHLGFHIFDVGFQSPNVEAARPMVYTTALLLILIVILLNVTAITLRNKLRNRFRLAGV